MAEPMTMLLAKKALVEAVSNKKVRLFIMSVVVGSLILLLMPVLILVSLNNDTAEYNRQMARIVFDGGPIPTDMFEDEHMAHMEDMINAFETLSGVIEESEEEANQELDDIKIKSFFYVFYLGKNASESEEEFYYEFVQCFVDKETDEEIYMELEEYLSEEIDEMICQEINALYLFIRYGYSANKDFSGIPGEAFNDETFAQLMGEATKYIGRKYVWGGSNPTTGFDCSGFVCWSYTQSGVYNLPRTTAQGLYNQCDLVSKDELKPGDLVFFHSTYSSSNPVTHVGIYVGDGQMLHCGDPIGYASLNNSYWIKHFYAYGRLSG